VAGAPEQVLTNERNKEADALAKIETLKASLANFN
jgi:valyl-tRNA synthetase